MMSEPKADSPALDGQGFLSEFCAWNRRVAENLARMNDIWPLTEEHWKVIDFVRDYYLKFAQGPVACKICRATGLSLRRLCELFPCGIVRGPYLLAGLPRPAGCA